MATITAYDVKSKTKGVTMLSPVIDINNGRYIAKGKAKNGNKLTAIMGKDKALAAVKDGSAKKGAGWAK